ncbi:hypothetical protein ACFYUL_17940 [Streptomyces sp. NPDC004311]|uniref:hypothetical protein n=1 Tax=Streptomyces sp. NPDC004311 TaxID=3364698 RepID=UPI0036CF1779
MTPNPHGFDPKTRTVRVHVHDLARLLLQFRTELERGRSAGDGRGSWEHGHDYDKSFEHLADIVDSTGVFPPDGRMRCKSHPVYEWPNRPAYREGAELVAVAVAGHGTHYREARAPRDLFRPGITLCGFHYAKEEERPAKKPVTCTTCVREYEVMVPIVITRRTA